MGQPICLSFSRDSITDKDAPIAPLRGCSGLWLAIMQAVLVLTGAGGMIAAPPATGRMLLVPLNGGDRDGLARIATHVGAALVDAGPFDDSLIVSGERSALLGAMVQGRMLVLRVAPGGCGDKGQDT